MDFWDETERSQLSTFHFSDVWLPPVETRHFGRENFSKIPSIPKPSKPRSAKPFHFELQVGCVTPSVHMRSQYIHI